MQPELHQMALTVEERDAFERAYQMHMMTPDQRQAITLACAPGFIIGYRSAKLEAEKASKQEKERLEARAKLAEMLVYPEQWDTAAYPNLESAAIEAIHTANTAANAFAKSLQEAENKSVEKGFYTMNQMRDYADGVVTTRAYVVIDSIENKASAFYKKADELHADGNPNVAGVYRQIASDLTGISADAKRLGRQPFQKRAMYWAKNCFGLTLAMSVKERNQRFAEKALELVQSCGMTKREVLGAADYVYSRPVGEKRQEVGGVYNTLAVLCAVHGIDMVGEGERDLLEIDNEEATTRIRLKRETKPDFAEHVVPLEADKFLQLLQTIPGSCGYLLYENGIISPNGKRVFENVKNVLSS